MKMRILLGPHLYPTLEPYMIRLNEWKALEALQILVYIHFYVGAAVLLYHTSYQGTESEILPQWGCLKGALESWMPGLWGTCLVKLCKTTKDLVFLKLMVKIRILQ